MNLISGEVDWINYLARGGASVAKAVDSEQGNLVEPIDDGQGGQFLATAFVRAPGGPPSQENWGQDGFLTFGERKSKTGSWREREISSYLKEVL